MDRKSAFVYGSVAAVIIFAVTLLLASQWRSWKQNSQKKRSSVVDAALSPMAEGAAGPTGADGAQRSKVHLPADTFTPFPVPSRTKQRATGLFAETKALQRGTKGRVLQLRVVSRGRCMMGDLDILREAVKKSTKGSLLLTLEPLMGGEEFSVTKRTVRVSQLERGFQDGFVLPYMAEPLHVGLFICKDDDGHGRCSQKSPAPMDRLYSVLRSNPTSPDMIYYFQYFLLEGDTAKIIHNDLGAEQYSALVDTLVARSPSPEGALAIVQKIRHLNQTLQSGNMESRGAFLTVDLPHLDNNYCEKGAPKSPFGSLITTDRLPEAEQEEPPVQTEEPQEEQSAPAEEVPQDEAAVLEGEEEPAYEDAREAE